MIRGSALRYAKAQERPGAKILGNVEIGEGAKVGAGSVVLDSVPPHTSVAGVPAKIIGKTKDISPALGMCHKLDN